jgi:Holliday junction resolvase RusA-like endonuclease
MIKIELPGEPRGKDRPRFLRNRAKPAYTTPRTAEYEESLAKVAMIAMAGRKPLDGPLFVTIRAYFGIANSWSKKDKASALAGYLRPTKKPDWENIAKTLDAFNGIVWVDDAQIVDARVTKEYSPMPRLVVEVYELGPPNEPD